MRYILTEDSRVHVLRHFGGSAASGSYFETSIFPDPDTLLAVLEGMEPEKKHQQGNGREAHVYSFPAGTVCGYVGLGKRRITTRRNGMKNYATGLLSNLRGLISSFLPIY